MASDYNILAVDHAIRKVGLTLVPYSEAMFPYVPANYRETVLADRPIGYWRLGETARTVAIDSSGNGYDGFYFNDGAGGLGQGQASLVTGDTDLAVGLSGAARVIMLPLIGNPFNFSPNSPFSIEAWLKPTAAPSATLQYVLSTGQYALRFNNGGVTFERVGFASAGPGLSSNVTVHLVGTYDGSALRLYRDGALVAGPVTDTTALATLTTPPTALFFGRHVGTNGGDLGGGLAAVLDECAVYDVALSGARIQAHYSAGITVGRLFGTDETIVTPSAAFVGNAARITPNITHGTVVSGPTGSPPTYVMTGPFSLVVELLNRESLGVQEVFANTFPSLVGTGSPARAVMLADEDVTYIAATGNTQRALFALAPARERIGAIKQIVIHIRARGVTGGSFATESVAFADASGVAYDNPSGVTGTASLFGISYQTSDFPILLNPKTGGAWAFNDLLTLVVGVVAANVTANGLRVTWIGVDVDTIDNSDNWSLVKLYRAGPTATAPLAPATGAVPLAAGRQFTFPETQPTPLLSSGQFYWYWARVYDFTGRERTLLGPVGIRQQ